MTETVTLRALTINDAAAASALIYAVVHAAPNLREHPNTQAWLDRWYDEAAVRTRTIENFGVGIWEGQELVATGWINELTGYITGVYVAKQRRGFGQQVMKALLDRLSENNAVAHMNVHVGSGMNRLAQSFGFTDAGRDPDSSFFPNEEYRVYRRLSAQ